MPDRHDRQEEWAVFWCNLMSPLLYCRHVSNGRCLHCLLPSRWDWPIVPANFIAWLSGTT